MAGQQRGPLHRMLVRLPEALFVDIKDEALRREISVNREIIRRCSLKRWSNQTMWELGYRYGQSPDNERLEITELPGSLPFNP